MDVHTAISLKGYTTMKMGGDARFMAPVSSVEDVAMVYRNAKAQNLPIFVLGGGSNVIAHDEGFEGIILLNRIKGFEVISDDKSSVVIRIGAGEIWDERYGVELAVRRLTNQVLLLERKFWIKMEEKIHEIYERTAHHVDTYERRIEHNRRRLNELKH